ncbi:hypothetical protein HDV06_005907 [Boothiomyces sp. JEL0866]|nr:hypothetical protein HDV06_005907 [Boothiomyces sp. JEL0866]
MQKKVLLEKSPVDAQPIPAPDKRIDEPSKSKAKELFSKNVLSENKSAPEIETHEEDDYYSRPIDFKSLLDLSSKLDEERDEYQDLFKKKKRKKETQPEPDKPSPSKKSRIKESDEEKEDIEILGFGKIFQDEERTELETEKKFGLSAVQNVDQSDITNGLSAVQNVDQSEHLMAQVTPIPIRNSKIKETERNSKKKRVTVKHVNSKMKHKEDFERVKEDFLNNSTKGLLEKWASGLANNDSTPSFNPNHDFSIIRESVIPTSISKPKLSSYFETTKSKQMPVLPVKRANSLHSESKLKSYVDHSVPIRSLFANSKVVKDGIKFDDEIDEPNYISILNKDDVPLPSFKKMKRVEPKISKQENLPTNITGSIRGRVENLHTREKHLPSSNQDYSKYFETRESKYLTNSNRDHGKYADTKESINANRDHGNREKYAQPSRYFEQKTGHSEKSNSKVVANDNRRRYYSDVHNEQFDYRPRSNFISSSKEKPDTTKQKEQRDNLNKKQIKTNVTQERFDSHPRNATPLSKVKPEIRKPKEPSWDYFKKKQVKEEELIDDEPITFITDILNADAAKIKKKEEAVNLLQSYVKSHGLEFKNPANKVYAKACDLEFFHEEYECIYCGEQKRLTNDHIIPISRKGTIKVKSCSTCNSLKGEQNLIEWIEKSRRTGKVGLAPTLYQFLLCTKNHFLLELVIADISKFKTFQEKRNYFVKECLPEWNNLLPKDELLF